MARLSPDGDWLIQLIADQVILFRESTEEVVVRFRPIDRDAVAMAQKAINDSDQLDDEQKSMAHFWSGYFYAHVTSGYFPPKAS